MFSTSVDYSFEISLKYKVMLYMTSNNNLICHNKKHLRTAGEKINDIKSMTSNVS